MGHLKDYYLRELTRAFDGGYLGEKLKQARSRISAAAPGSAEALAAKAEVAELERVVAAKTEVN